MNEFEIVQYGQMAGLHLFFNTVDYRTPHFHAEWELIWLLENQLSIAWQQNRFVLEPGQLMLVAPGELHEFHRLGQKSTFLCMQLSPEVLPQCDPVSMEGKLPQDCFSAGALEQMKGEIAQIADAYLHRIPGYELLCMGKSCLLLYELLGGLPHHTLTPEEASGLDRRNARLNRLIDFVDRNYMHKIRLEDFAAEEGCSPGYLSRFIKETMNQTFRDYVASVRFNCACKLIAEGGLRLLDVCMESGFSDYRYFSRAFQEHYHMTPEEFSRCSGAELASTATVQRSLHSMETFYSREESLKLLQKYRNK